MGIAATKADLRRDVLDARRTRAADPEVDAARTAALLALPELQAASTVAAYTALRGEPDLRAVLDALRPKGVRVLLPVTLPDRDLRFVAGSEEVAIVEADVVLVPALGADRTGRRLGRGGGSYDRALPWLRLDALSIAVVHAEELLEQVPVEPHDARVGAVLAGAVLLKADARETTIESGE